MPSWEELQRKNSEEYWKKVQAKEAEKLYGHSTYKGSSGVPNSSSSSGSSSNYSSGGSYVGSPSSGSIPTSRLIAIFIVIVLIVGVVFVISNYNSYYNGEWTYATADKQSSRSAQNYQNYLLSLDSEYAYWHITYEKDSSDILNYLAKFVKLGKTKGYSMGGYNSESGKVFDYLFEGDDAGTGIPDGRYTLAILDGINVLIDDNNEIIYKEGTEFYDTYAPKLKALSHDKALGVVLERTQGGEHALSGSNDSWMEFIRKDNSMVYSYMLSDDVSKISGGEFRAITTYPKDKMEERWIFSYGDSEYALDDLDGYMYFDDETFGSDELGVLMNKNFDSTGSIQFYKNDESVLGIYVRYFPNGYEFEVRNVVEGYDKGLEEDIVYRINTTENTLTKITNYDYSDEIQENMPLSQYQDTYDFLLNVVPHTYIRRIIDLDKAEIRKESVGLVKVYEMKDKDGNVTADMKVAFGLMGEVNHYTAKDEYVKIELEY